MRAYVECKVPVLVEVDLDGETMVGVYVDDDRWRVPQNNDGRAVEGSAGVAPSPSTIVPVAGVGVGSGGCWSAVAASRTLR